MLAGGIGAFVTSFIEEGFSPSPIKDFWPFFKYVAILIVLSNVIFYNMYGTLLRKYSITFLTFAGFLCPLFGTFFGWFFREETITWHYWVSLSAITVALFIFYREELKQPVVVEAT
jgi:drug/metabolite transporter (DMT)-like permease